MEFDSVVINGKHNLLKNPVDNLSFDVNLLETHIAQDMIFKGRRGGIIHNWATADLGYKLVETFAGGVS